MARKRPYTFRRGYRRTKKGRFKDPRYQKWRIQVLENAKYQCQSCGKKGGLHCHHMKSWARHISLRFDPSNGMALCPACHWQEHAMIRQEKKGSVK